MHVMDFCEGYYQPKDITSCSSTSRFDLRGILLQQIDQGARSNIDLSTATHWPTTVTAAFQMIDSYFHVMHIVYCIAIGTAAAGVFLSLVSLRREARRSAIASAICNTMAFIFGTVASGLATHIIGIGATINQPDNDIGVNAMGGAKFMGLTWASSMIMLLGAICRGSDLLISPYS